MEKLEKYSVIELEKKDLISTEGGSLFRLLVAVVYDIINNPQDFAAGYNAARANN